MKTLAKHRRMTGLSQHELARRADVRFSRLCYAENGRTKLTADELARIKAVLAERGRTKLKPVHFV
jgi:predicted transcriptional regulator